MSDKVKGWGAVPPSAGWNDFCRNGLFPRRLKELPPAGMRLCLEVRRELETLVPDASGPGKVLVAFSGGADSTALAVILHCLRIPLALAHLDHQLRPESAGEAETVRHFAEALGVACQIERQNVAALAREQRLGLEDAGRRARYLFLEKARQEQQAAWIVTGHHLDDVCEDVLLRLIRGAGWPALAGMRAVDPKRRLLRPLLGIRHEDLREFLRSLGLVWIEDASNAGTDFRRNRIRNTLLPLLEAENPALSRAIRTLWQLAREDETYWETLLTPILHQARPVEVEGAPAWFLPRSVLVFQPRAVRLRLYMALIRLTGRGQARAETLFRLDRAVMASRSYKRFQLPGSLSIETDERGITVR